MSYFNIYLWNIVIFLFFFIICTCVFPAFDAINMTFQRKYTTSTKYIKNWFQKVLCKQKARSKTGRSKQTTIFWLWENSKIFSLIFLNNIDFSFSYLFFLSFFLYIYLGFDFYWKLSLFLWFFMFILWIFMANCIKLYNIRMESVALVYNV